MNNRHSDKIRQTNNKYSRLDAANVNKSLNSSQKARAISKDVVKTGPSLRQTSDARTYANTTRKTAAHQNSNRSRSYFIDSKKSFADNDALDEETFAFENYDLSKPAKRSSHDSVSRLFEEEELPTPKETRRRSIYNDDAYNRKKQSQQNGRQEAPRRQRIEADAYAQRSAQTQRSRSVNEERRYAPASSQTRRRSSEEARYRTANGGDNRRNGGGRNRGKTNHASPANRSPSPPKKNTSGVIILALQAVLSVLLIVVFSLLNVLPGIYFFLMIAVLVFLWLLVLLSQITHYKKMPLVGKIFAVLLCVALAVGNYYAFITNKAIDTVSEETTDEETTDEETTDEETTDEETTDEETTDEGGEEGENGGEEGGEGGEEDV